MGELITWLVMVIPALGGGTGVLPICSRGACLGACPLLLGAQTIHLIQKYGIIQILATANIS